jgi:hypothetical protein
MLSCHDTRYVHVCCGLLAANTNDANWTAIDGKISTSILKHYNMQFDGISSHTHNEERSISTHVSTRQYEHCFAAHYCLAHSYKQNLQNVQLRTVKHGQRYSAQFWKFVPISAMLAMPATCQ